MKYQKGQLTFVPHEKKVLCSLFAFALYIASREECFMYCFQLLLTVSCVYFYYGANKSASRAMWVLRQSDAISVFFYGEQCAQYPDFSWLKKIHCNMFVCCSVHIQKWIILYFLQGGQRLVWYVQLSQFWWIFKISLETFGW